jgi:hypothetical protein
MPEAIACRHELANTKVTVEETKVRLKRGNSTLGRHVIPFSG